MKLTKSKTDKKNDTVNLVFSDYWDFYKWLDKNKRENGHSVNAPNDNYGAEVTATFPETVEFMNAGWPEGSKNIRDIASRIDATFEDGDALSVQYDVCGDFIDIGTYLEGVPECMGQIVTVQRPMETVNVYVEVGAKWSISARTIENRGAGVAAIIDKLRDKYSVVLHIQNSTINCHFSNNKVENIHLDIRVETENSYSQDLVAFFLAHTAFLRRLVFCVTEIICEKDDCGGYGKPSQRRPNDPKGIYFEKINNNEDCWQGPKRAGTEIARILKDHERRLDELRQ